MKIKKFLVQLSLITGFALLCNTYGKDYYKSFAMELSDDNSVQNAYKRDVAKELYEKNDNTGLIIFNTIKERVERLVRKDKILSEDELSEKVRERVIDLFSKCLTDEDILNLEKFKNSDNKEILAGFLERVLKRLDDESINEKQVEEPKKIFINGQNLKNIDLLDKRELKGLPRIPYIDLSKIDRERGKNDAFYKFAQNVRNKFLIFLKENYKTLKSTRRDTAGKIFVLEQILKGHFFNLFILGRDKFPIGQIPEVEHKFIMELYNRINGNCEKILEEIKKFVKPVVDLRKEKQRINKKFVSELDNYVQDRSFISIRSVLSVYIETGKGKEAFYSDFKRIFELILKLKRDLADFIHCFENDFVIKNFVDDENEAAGSLDFISKYVRLYDAISENFDDDPNTNVYNCVSGRSRIYIDGMLKLINNFKGSVRSERFSLEYLFKTHDYLSKFSSILNQELGQVSKDFRKNNPEFFEFLMSILGENFKKLGEKIREKIKQEEGDIDIDKAQLYSYYISYIDEILFKLRELFEKAKNTLIRGYEDLLHSYKLDDHGFKEKSFSDSEKERSKELPDGQVNNFSGLEKEWLEILSDSQVDSGMIASRAKKMADYEKFYNQSLSIIDHNLKLLNEALSKDNNKRRLVINKFLKDKLDEFIVDEIKNACQRGELKKINVDFSNKWEFLLNNYEGSVIEEALYYDLKSVEVYVRNVINKLESKNYIRFIDYQDNLESDNESDNEDDEFKVYDRDSEEDYMGSFIRSYCMDIDDHQYMRFFDEDKYKEFCLELTSSSYKDLNFSDFQKRYYEIIDEENRKLMDKEMKGKSSEKDACFAVDKDSEELRKMFFGYEVYEKEKIDEERD